MDYASVLRDVLIAISPESNAKGRSLALNIVKTLSNYEDFLKLYYHNDNELLNSLDRIVDIVDLEDRRHILVVLVNISTLNVDSCRRIIEQRRLICNAIECCQKDARILSSITRHSNNTTNIDEKNGHPAVLLNNLSRFCAAEMHEIVITCWPKFMANALDSLNSNSSECITYLAYTVLNFSRISQVSEEICEKHSMKLAEVISGSGTEVVLQQRIAIDILLNVVNFDGNRPKLLADLHCLTNLLKPLMDDSYRFDEREKCQLPLSLQLYRGSRVDDQQFIGKLIQLFFVLVQMENGACRLAKLGLYAILRELDRSLTDDEPASRNIIIVGNANEANGIKAKKLPGFTLIDENSNMLHLLIAKIIECGE